MELPQKVLYIDPPTKKANESVDTKLEEYTSEVDTLLSQFIKLIAGLQIISQNLWDIISRRNEIPSDIYKNVSDVNLHHFFSKI